MTSSQSKYGYVTNSGKKVFSDVCLTSKLGHKVDLRWNIKQAIMQISPSIFKQFSILRDKQQQIWQGIPLAHSKTCQLCDKNFKPNSQKAALPCAVVLIQNEQNKKILATRRHLSMSFSGQWVLPGGHLQKQQRMSQGGLRQCNQQIGLPYGIIKQNYLENCQPMLWQSILQDRQKMQIKRVAFVLFFRIKVKQFQVKVDEKEVWEWQWRQFEKGQYPWGGGWAQGHETYLKYLYQQKKK